MAINFNPFIVHANNKSVIEVDSDGYTVIDKMVLIDQKDGKKWDFSIYDGQLLIEPHGKSEKRDFRINKVIS